MAKPAKPIVPPPPLRSNPETFSARMEASLLFWKTFADYLDALGDHAEAQADAALAAALAAGAGTGLALKGNGGKVMAVNAGATALEFLTASGAGKAILAGADAAAQRATLGLVIGKDVLPVHPPVFTTQATQNNGFAGGIVGRNDGSGTAGVAFDANIRGALVGGMQVQDSGSWGTDVRLLANRRGSSDADRRFVALAVNSEGARFTPSPGAPEKILPSYDCRAWVNFNGTGTVAIRAAGNVSSITDNGVGDYTVNFATAMPDANYCAQITIQDMAIGRALTRLVSATASALRLVTTDAAGTPVDTPYVNVAIFR